MAKLIINKVMRTSEEKNKKMNLTLISIFPFLVRLCRRQDSGNDGE